MARNRLLSGGWQRAYAVVTACVVSVAFAAPAQGAAPPQAPSGEYQTKAAFLYNFAKFVQWPSGRHTGALVICVIGVDPFGAAIDKLIKGNSIDGRELAVQRLDAEDDLGVCHIVFVSGSETLRTPEILKRAQAAGVLTVGEMPPFVRDGGVIRFYLEGNRVRFQIDARNAKEAGLTISSQLLSLAKR